MNSVLTKISAIKRNPNNPRILKDDKFAKLTQSIKDFPQMLEIRPIVVNDDMVVLGGNMRLKACKEAGLKEVPVMKVSDLTEDQQREFIIKDNVGFGEWDWDLLANEWDADLLEDWGMELDFNPVDDNDGLTDEDDTPEVTENPVSKVGDIWLLGEHRVMCGDSTDKIAVDSLMDGKKADLLLTDPPYGIGYGGSMKLGQEKHGWKQYRGGWDEERPSNEWIDNSFGIATNQIVWGGNYFTDVLPPRMGWLIWDKGQREFSMADGEMAWTSFDNALRIKTIHRAEALKDGKVHPTQKSIELLMWSIDYNDRNAKKEAKLIMDLFLGSGSTLIAADKKDRNCYGMELDPLYVDVIIKRWQEYTGKNAIHAETGEQFKE